MADRLDKVREAAEAVLLAYERCHHLPPYMDALRAALDAPLAAPSGGDATRDEAVVAWAGFNRHGTLIDLDPDKETVEKCVASESTYYPQHGPYRVVALVPQHKEP